MRIGVIGAYGKAGSLIAREACQRGHAVTAIVRDVAKLTEKCFAGVINKDLFDLTAEDLRGLDALVCAVSLPSAAGNAQLYQKAVDHLIEVLRQLPATRLLMVGGAASLFTDAQRQHPVLEQIPEEWRPVPADMAKALEKLAGSDINWTFFSPAVNFDCQGKRTGQYTLGSDYVITNASNECYISYEDYAIAMVDEIENKFHERRRFTAVSDSRPEPAAESHNPDEDTGYYGILAKKPEFYGLSRYRPPFNFELAGRHFKLVMDREDDYFVNILDGHTLEWSTFARQPSAREYYECAKIDELTYFVNFELTGVAPRTNLTLILDLEQRLVTFVRTYTGFNAKYPYLVESDFDFGAIDLPGFTLPQKRHSFTTDLVGKRALWSYGPRASLVHVYYSPNYIRATFAPGRKPPEPATPEEREDWEKHPYDEPAAYIKIKEGIYVISVLEQRRAFRGDTGNSLLFLMDMIRVHDVGRSFGHGPIRNGKAETENYLFAAYGDFVYSDGVLEARPSVYND
jgi:uncharacterized protein